MDLLRFSTAGSVDDGKSTLIGRLLYDSKAIMEDQFEAIRKSSEQRGKQVVDLALLTDGLRAEREQGITIDVAYRYFSTPKRKFIIADTPGHVQYTRNMVTGASTAELAIVLIDARHGVLTQSRRHGFIASLLQIPHMIVAVNKMDLVDYSEEVFRNIVSEYSKFAEQLDVENIIFIPLSALEGDNVVDRSSRMPWYEGSTLLHHLETVKVGADRNAVDFRFPVQTVLRPNLNFRGFAGEVASGSIEVGEDIMVLPSRQQSKVKSLHQYDAQPNNVRVGEPAVITLTDEIDISRGDMIVRSRNLPSVSDTIDAHLCWMDADPMTPGKRYILQMGPRTVQAVVDKIIYRIDVNTLHREEARALQLNDISRVEITTAEPIAFDPYKINRRTGCFILIDPDSNTTVGAGMIRGTAQDVPAVGSDPARVTIAQRTKSTNVVWEGLNVPREQREVRNGHQATVVWLTGLSGSGKTTIAREVEKALFAAGKQTMLLDGDTLRHGLNGDLGFSPFDRAENIRRAGEAARLFFEHGNIVLCTFISPYADDRAFVRSLFPSGRFMEVHVDADLDTLKARDPKGLYERALRGEIPAFTGVSAPYDRPETPELRLDTASMDIPSCVQAIVDLIG